MSDTVIHFEVRLSDEEMALDVEAWLRENDVSDSERQELFGIEPVLTAVIAGTIGFAAITQLVLRIRGNFECQQIVDARGDTVVTTTQCEHRNGKIIVIADKDEVVSVTDVPDVIDITEIGKTAITQGAEVAKAAIEAAGGKAKVEPNPTTPSETTTL